MTRTLLVSLVLFLPVGLAPAASGEEDHDAVAVRLAEMLEAGIERRAQELAELDARVRVFEAEAEAQEVALARARAAGEAAAARDAAAHLEELEEQVLIAVHSRNALAARLPALRDRLGARRDGPAVRVFDVGALLEDGVDVAARVKREVPGVEAVVVRGRYMATAGGDVSRLRAVVALSIVRGDLDPADMRTQILDVRDLLEEGTLDALVADLGRLHPAAELHVDPRSKRLVVRGTEADVAAVAALVDRRRAERAAAARSEAGWPVLRGRALDALGRREAKGAVAARLHDDVLALRVEVRRLTRLVEELVRAQREGR